jgi:hypothetical protein
MKKNTSKLVQALSFLVHRSAIDLLIHIRENSSEGSTARSASRHLVQAQPSHTAPPNPAGLILPIVLPITALSCNATTNRSA